MATPGDLLDILALTHRTPFKPDRGDRIRSFHLLRGLGARHRIWLCSMDEAEPDSEVAAALDTFCHRHAVFALSPMRRYWGAARSLLQREPLTLGYFRHPGAVRQIRGWADATRFDAAFVFSSSMAPYWLTLNRTHRVPAVMDLIDVDSEKWRQYADRARGPRRWIYRRERKVLAQYERAIAAAAAHTLLVSQAEVETFQDVAPGVVAEALDNGVDHEFFARPRRARRADPPRIVFVGQMDYEANIDGVRSFVETVLPLVWERRPDLRFDIVGARPAPRVKELAQLERIRVTGWVEDVRPYLWESTVAVAPLRIAQGTQNKVLEAMAASVPVVATSVAVRGLTMAEPSHLAVRDDPREFADSILELIESPERAAGQAEAALAMVRRHFSWDSSVLKLEGLLERTAQTTAVEVF